MEKITTVDLSNWFDEVLEKETYFPSEEEIIQAQSFFSQILNKTVFNKENQEIEYNISNNIKDNIIVTTVENVIWILTLFDIKNNIKYLKSLEELYVFIQEFLISNDEEQSFFDELCENYSQNFSEENILNFCYNSDFFKDLSIHSTTKKFIEDLSKTNDFKLSLENLILDENLVDDFSRLNFFSQNIENIITWFDKHIDKLIILSNYIENPFNWLKN